MVRLPKASIFRRHRCRPAWPGKVPPRIGRAVAPQPPFPHFLRTLAAWRCGRPRFMMMVHDMYGNVHVEKCGT